MNAVFQVSFEESPEARKFSKDLRASFFVLPKMCSICQMAPEWTGQFKCVAALETKRMEIIALWRFAQYLLLGTQVAAVGCGQCATRRAAAWCVGRDTVARYQAAAES